MFGQRFAGLAFTLFFVLASVLFWGFILHAWAAKPDAPDWVKGLNLNFG